jgi:membrane protein DedA with SNARE-associated domain
MNGFETFLDSYGLLAIFSLLLVKAVGVPIPVPADVIMLTASARVAAGKMVLWQAFLFILLALVLGGIVQFWLARGPGRQLLYRFGRYLGLTPARLDAAAAKVKKGGPVGVGLAILTPGIRAATVAACGLAGLSLKTFVIGLTLGSALFLSLHFFLGYIGGSLWAKFTEGLSGFTLLSGGLALLLIGLGVWYLIRRWQRPAAPRGEALAEAVEAWHEATCPLCLALGATSRVRPVFKSGLAQE